ncbi:GntR family transcriptional regulator [Comamonadaceae bacterium G21597-S1]|nr:GntR family transcriptional regulator [Comamonadaceae bacterium G21597-S1]
MSSQIERVVTELRGRILSGQLPAGHRVVELQFAQELAVSRTPLRLALGELEKEGLLERLPTRGFKVRAFTLDQIADAVDVRGTLEGMAARLAVERGVPFETLEQMRSCLVVGQSLVDEADRLSCGVNALQWSELNLRFHSLIVSAGANDALAATLQFVSRIPMAGANALTLQGQVPSVETSFIRRAQQDHVDLVQALEQKAGSRAEAIMREHAFRSRENKKLLIARLARTTA